MVAVGKVAVVMGAWRGVGAALVEVHRKRGYGDMATAQSMKPTDDVEVIGIRGDIAGDIANGKTVQQAISEGAGTITGCSRRSRKTRFLGPIPWFRRYLCPSAAFSGLRQTRIVPISR